MAGHSSTPWRELGIARTRDERAYSARLKLTRPEDDPLAFQRLRDAYEAALSYARSAADSTQVVWTTTSNWDGVRTDAPLPEVSEHDRDEPSAAHTDEQPGAQAPAESDPDARTKLDNEAYAGALVESFMRNAKGRQAHDVAFALSLLLRDPELTSLANA